MQKTTQHNEGGCFCGAVRYALIGPPDWSSHCHCRSCQKAVGAAFTTWVGAKQNHQRSNYNLRLARCRAGILWSMRHLPDICC